MSKGAQIAVGATAVAVLLAWYGATNLEPGSTYQYYQTLDEFLAAAPGERGDSLRVHGYVADGSIERDVGGKQVFFAVQNDPPHAAVAPSGSLRVVYLGLETPDLFADGAEVVIEGRLDGEGDRAVFIAHNVLAKCPSKFEAQAPEAAEL